MISRTMFMAAVLLSMALAGCGSGMLKTKGRITKSGAPFTLKQGEDLCIYFCPVKADGSPGTTVYPAFFNPADSTFQVTGSDKNGMPAGKYRVWMEHTINKKDLFKGAYSMTNTPYVFDVDSSTREIEIDLDKKP
ncbi:hypothetical protein [Zavarzinella formosa]|uniref:hypothetical protein n=1 Tax=Zavarzinella formosa TaxID=360055 RepID=UPI0002FC1CED|nr:hypothetical protein [Zavarzinella formosa]